MLLSLPLLLGEKSAIHPEVEDELKNKEEVNVIIVVKEEQSQAINKKNELKKILGNEFNLRKDLNEKTFSKELTFLI